MAVSLSMILTPVIILQLITKVLNSFGREAKIHLNVKWFWKDHIH